MEHKGSLLSWRLSLAESLAMAAVVASVTLWMTTKFQSKEDAAKQDTRISAVESEQSNLRSSINSIAVDISYVRGKIENADLKSRK